MWCLLPLTSNINHILPIKEGRKIALKPMCAYDRKIIHNALAKFKDVNTKSRYEEPNRRIIIYPTREGKLV